MEKEKKNFIQKLKIEFNICHKYAFFAAIIIGILAHFTLYSQLITTTDGFTFGTRYYAGEWEISLGRWFIVVLNYFRYGLVSPAYITFFSLFILGVISVFIIDIYEIKKKLTTVMISACLVLAPFVYQTLLYEFTADAYFFALLLSVLTVFFYKRENKIFCVFSIILLMATYQSYINVVMFLGLTLIMLNIIQNKKTPNESLKDFVVYYIVCGVGILFYYIVTQIVLKMTGIQLSVYSGASSNGFLEIIKNLPNGIFEAYSTTYSYFFNDNIINNGMYYRGILYIIMFFFLVIHIFLQDDKVNIAMIICFILLSPLMLAFVEILVIYRDINILMSASFICPILFIIKLK